MFLLSFALKKSAGRGRGSGGGIADRDRAVLALLEFAESTAMTPMIRVITY